MPSSQLYYLERLGERTKVVQALCLKKCLAFTVGNELKALETFTKKHKREKDVLQKRKLGNLMS